MRLLTALVTLWFTALAPLAPAQSFEELRDRVLAERDAIEDGEVRQLAEFETREAMEALLEAYDRFASAYRRREVVVELKRFDEHDESFQPALEKLMNIAVGERSLEVRTAALESLGLCLRNGPSFLALIVESNADDSVRERAMELHVRLSEDSSDGWYRKIYERSLGSVQEELRGADSKKKKGRGRRGERETEPKKEIIWPTAQLRATAMGAIIESLTVDELQVAVERDRSGGVRRAALAELARRGDRSALDHAERIFGRPDVPYRDRALAADILLDEQGVDVAGEFIDVALKAPTPEFLRTHLAGLLAELKDERVDKKLVKLIGKGKAQQKVFALRSTVNVNDPKLLKRIRKGLREKQEEVVVATVDALIARRDRESIEDLEKLFEKTKLDGVRAAALRGLSALYDGENEWVVRLKGLTDSEDLDTRNAALAEIARLGRRNMDELYIEKLSDENWSTRLIALRALESRRDASVLAPIIARMAQEQGRMAIEFGETLFRLTGQAFGARASSWERWLAATPVDEIEIVPESELETIIAATEERKLRQVSSAAFFGVRIESHRVLFILDVSGSMNEPMRAEYVGELGRPRIDVAKEELAKAIRSLDAGALFNIVPFSGGVDSWLEGGVAGADDDSREDALVYIDRLGADGGTNLYGSLEFAFDDPDVDTVFILSDGEPSVGDIIDPQLIREAIAERNATRNVVINTIAFGADLQVLEWLAEDSGGTHVSID
ncbi:MAG: hypothetical protein ACPGPE_00810 [Planctomycetota bacterium]